MTKILVLSDSHNNQILLRKVLSQEKGCDILFHLGDYYEDLEGNDDLTDKKKIFRVPGIYHRDYFSGKLNKIETVNVHDFRFTLVHNIADLDRSNLETDIVFYGHTHIVSIDEIEDVYYINPGHIKAKIDRNQEASYIVCDLNNNELQLFIKNLTGVKKMEKKIKLRR